MHYIRDKKRRRTSSLCKSCYPGRQRFHLCKRSCKRCGRSFQSPVHSSKRNAIFTESLLYGNAVCLPQTGQQRFNNQPGQHFTGRRYRIGRSDSKRPDARRRPGGRYHRHQCSSLQNTGRLVSGDTCQTYSRNGIRQRNQNTEIQRTAY